MPTPTPPRSPPTASTSPPEQAVVRLDGRDIYLGKHGSRREPGEVPTASSPRWLATAGQSAATRVPDGPRVERHRPCPG